MIRDESITRSFMLLCLGAAFLTLLVRSQTNAASLTPQQPAINLPLQPVKTASASLKPKPVTLAQAQTRLVVDLSDRKVSLYRSQKLQASYPIAIGQVGWETPTGTFAITQMQTNPVWQHPITEQLITAGPDSPLGLRWIGFWSDGHNQIGFHGTNQEELIGQAVSHGCVRMRNQDIVALYQQVAEGTPVIVQP
ncbi:MULTISPECIES: L,D-transpeptidase [Trichocoleus]|uniref:L,D-transpeptidase n=1 Tax=Trichocoleus desertorum GB2-A4 TaxID=2933944 RepID=A0ABV0J4U6_9CYAN|nr:L,D-transpeptidase [Trichocoleus sp. FACHB-46]